MARPREDPIANYYAKVDQSGGPDACWPWTGALDGHGYGTYKIAGVGQRGAHRWAYSFARNLDVPAAVTLDHTCHTRDPACSRGPDCPHRRCCNPAHLEPVTNRENVVVRGRGLSARNASAEHCPRGHPYDDANTYHRPNGGRGCRICRAEASLRSRQRHVLLNA